MDGDEGEDKERAVQCLALFIQVLTPCPVCQQPHYWAHDLWHQMNLKKLVSAIQTLAANDLIVCFLKTEVWLES